MSAPEEKPKILSIDDESAIHLLIPAFLGEVGSVEMLDSKNMDVAAAVDAIRLKLEGVDILILDGRYEDPKRTNDQTALQIIQRLAPELSAKGVTVIVYSSDDEILKAVKSFYPSVSVVTKPGNFDSIKEAISQRVPFEVSSNA